ncbi:MAG: TetR family transcriptional regulator C-terminal domain-containing protein [Bacilli bacterium]|nr:TetR family transcriptional regulator C-terminal domain-containing protein [Bacilli bacterium]
MKWERLKKEVLFPSLETLLNDCKPDDLNFLKVSNATGISRTTLYFHYETINDAFIDLLQCFEQELQNRLAKDNDSENSHDDLMRMLLFVRDNYELLKVVKKIYHLHPIGNELRSTVRAIVLSSLIKDSSDCGEIEVTFVWNGFVGVIRKWLNEGCVTAPEDIHEALILRKI